MLGSQVTNKKIDEVPLKITILCRYLKANGAKK
jgi:hypothetical protein